MFGVSRPTFYKARSDFDRSGLVGLLPAKRGPRQPHKITPEVARFIEETVRREELTAQRLVERIAERFGLVVHQRTVKRALARLKKKCSEPRCRQSRWSCVGSALRGFAKRRGLRRSPPYVAQFSAAHAKRDGSVDQRRRARAPGTRRYHTAGFVSDVRARGHSAQPRRYRRRHGFCNGIGGCAMSSDTQSKVQARHLKRSAFLYVRQSWCLRTARALNGSMICVSELSHSVGISIK